MSQHPSFIQAHQQVEFPIENSPHTPITQEFDSPVQFPTPEIIPGTSFYDCLDDADRQQHPKFYLREFAPVFQDITVVQYYLSNRSPNGAIHGDITRYHVYQQLAVGKGQLWWRFKPVSLVEWFQAEEQHRGWFTYDGDYGKMESYFTFFNFVRDMWIPSLDVLRINSSYINFLPDPYKKDALNAFASAEKIIKEIIDVLGSGIIHIDWALPVPRSYIDMQQNQ